MLCRLAQEECVSDPGSNRVRKEELDKSKSKSEENLKKHNNY